MTTPNPIRINLIKADLIRVLTPMLQNWNHGASKEDTLHSMESYIRLLEIVETFSDEKNTTQESCLDNARDALKILLDGFEKTGNPVPCEVVAELEYVISTLGHPL